MTWLMSRHRLRIQNLQLHNFVKNDQKRHSFVEGFSSIKLTWIWKKNLSLNVMYICCNYFNYVEFKRLQVHNFKKNGQNASKYCRTSFLHRTNKNMTKQGGGGHFGLRSSLMGRLYETNWFTAGPHQKLDHCFTWLNKIVWVRACWPTWTGSLR